MIKHLQFLFASIIMLAFGMNISAQNVTTFTFNEADSYKQFGLNGWSGKINDVETSDGDITENKTITIGDVTFMVTPTGGDPATRMYKDYNGNYGLRSYSGTQFVISSTKNIAKIEFTAKKFNFNAEAGTLAGTTWTPEGNMTTATFNCFKSSTTESIVVTLAEEGTVDPEPTPGETTEIYSVTFNTQEAVDSWTKEGGMAKYKDFATFDAKKGCVALNQYMDNGTTYFISPAMTLGADNNTVSFENTEFAFPDEDASKFVSLVIRTTDGAAWEVIEGAKYGNNWKEFISSGELAVPAKFNGKEVQFGFECRFNLTETGGSGYLYVKNFKVASSATATPDPEPEPEPEPTPGENTEIYSVTFNSQEAVDSWTKEGGMAKYKDFATFDANKGCVALNQYMDNGTTYFISPAMTLGADNNTVSFENTEFAFPDEDASKFVSLVIRTTDGAAWEVIEGAKYGNNWKEFISSGELAVPAKFNGKEVQFGFECRYNLTETGGSGYLYVKSFKVVSSNTSNPDPQPEEVIAENIAAFNELCTKDGADVTLKLTDAKVLYVNAYTDNKGNDKQEVFVKDATASFMFYNVGLTVKNGDVLNGSIKGAAKDFFGTKEFCTNANTDVTTLTVTEGDAAEGEVKALNEVAMTDVSNLITVNNVKMISKEETDSKGKTHTNYYMVDANDNELGYYNKFHVEGCDAADLVDQVDLSFTGIITLHYGTLQLCPIAPVYSGIDCIENAVLDVNAPMYNVAGQKVNANYKGIVLQNGKKFFNK